MSSNEPVEQVSLQALAARVEALEALNLTTAHTLYRVLQDGSCAGRDADLAVMHEVLLEEVKATLGARKTEPACQTCGDTGQILHMWDRPGGAPGNGMGPCPACSPAKPADPAQDVREMARGVVREALGHAAGLINISSCINALADAGLLRGPLVVTKDQQGIIERSIQMGEGLERAIMNAGIADRIQVED